MSDLSKAHAAILPLLERLVGFDTTSRNSNLALIDYIQSYLNGLGIKSSLIRNEAGDKANLFATIGPNVAGGVVLSGHTDVVPVDGQPWTTDPFKLHHGEDGKLHARGTADMKGFIAVCLAYAPVFKAANLKRPVHFAFTYDEEVGCLGIQAMLPHLRAHCATPRLVVVGEPTNMQVAAAHKGQFVSRTRIRGREAHSSRPEDGVNAVVTASELIGVIMGYARRERERGPQDAMFDTPYTSFNVGPISGGSVFNTVPGDCEFDWEFRPVPACDGQKIIDEYAAYLRDELNPRLRLRVATGALPRTKFGLTCRHLWPHRVRTLRLWPKCWRTAMIPRLSGLEPKAATSRASISRRLCAAPVILRRRTSRVNLSPRASLRPALAL